jgi:hypothetical protein
MTNRQRCVHAWSPADVVTRLCRTRSVHDLLSLRTSWNNSTMSVCSKSRSCLDVCAVKMSWLAGSCCQWCSWNTLHSVYISASIRCPVSNGLHYVVFPSRHQCLSCIFFYQFNYKIHLRVHQMFCEKKSPYFRFPNVIKYSCSFTSQFLSVAYSRIKCCVSWFAGEHLMQFNACPLSVWSTVVEVPFLMSTDEPAFWLQ